MKRGPAKKRSPEREQGTRLAPLTLRAPLIRGGAGGGNAMAEFCRCQHTRDQHADRENPLQVVPLAMTEADAEDAGEELPLEVRGVGRCTVEGCGCEEFSPAPP